MTAPDSRTAAEHTPGPWRTASLRGCAVFASDICIATVFEDDDRNAPADAQLMAAAPDLLAALEEQTRTIDWMLSVATLSAARTLKEFDPTAYEGAMREHVAARAAIAKARGIGQGTEEETS